MASNNQTRFQPIDTTWSSQANANGVEGAYTNLYNEAYTPGGGGGAQTGALYNPSVTAPTDTASTASGSVYGAQAQAGALYNPSIGTPAESATSGIAHGAQPQAGALYNPSLGSPAMGSPSDVTTASQSSTTSSDSLPSDLVPAYQQFISQLPASQLDGLYSNLAQMARVGDPNAQRIESELQQLDPTYAQDHNPNALLQLPSSDAASVLDAMPPAYLQATVANLKPNEVDQLKSQYLNQNSSVARIVEAMMRLPDFKAAAAQAAQQVDSAPVNPQNAAAMPGAAGIGLGTAAPLLFFGYQGGMGITNLVRKGRGLEPLHPVGSLFEKGAQHLPGAAKARSARAAATETSGSHGSNSQHQNDGGAPAQPPEKPGGGTGSEPAGGGAANTAETAAKTAAKDAANTAESGGGGFWSGVGNFFKSAGKLIGRGAEDAGSVAGDAGTVLAEVPAVPV